MPARAAAAADTTRAQGIDHADEDRMATRGRPATVSTEAEMETVRARLDELEKRVEALHERLNDILEALAAQWQTLTDAAKATTVSIARTVPPPVSLELKRHDGTSAA